MEKRKWWKQTFACSRYTETKTKTILSHRQRLFSRAGNAVWNPLVKTTDYVTHTHARARTHALLKDKMLNRWLRANQTFSFSLQLWVHMDRRGQGGQTNSSQSLWCASAGGGVGCRGCYAKLFLTAAFAINVQPGRKHSLGSPHGQKVCRVYVLETRWCSSSLTRLVWNADLSHVWVGWLYFRSRRLIKKNLRDCEQSMKNKTNRHIFHLIFFYHASISGSFSPLLFIYLFLNLLLALGGLFLLRFYIWGLGASGSCAVAVTSTPLF